MFNNFSDGHIILYLGPMFGSKSSALYDELIRRHYGGQTSLMVKKSNDERYNKNKVETHDKKYSNIIKTTIKDNIYIYELEDGIKINNVCCNYLYEINDIVKNYDVILIDEIQFFDDAYIYCDKWANENKIVIGAGLIGTFQRTIFNVISQLIPRSEYIIIKNAVCKDTGRTASFSERLIKSDQEVLFGGKDAYKPVDRKTYFNDMTNEDFKNYIFNEIVEFANIINKPIDEDNKKKLKIILNEKIKNKTIDFDYFEIIKNL